MQTTAVIEAKRKGEGTEWLPFQLPHWSEVSLTLCLAAIAGVIALVPEAAALLQFDRHAVASGYWWQVFSGHFVHWNHEHLFWDLSVFVVLGSICECRDRRRYVLTLIAAGLSIPLVVWALVPGLQTYRGLSGLDTALFTLLAVGILQEKWRDRQWTWVLLIGGLLACFAAKTGFELFTGGTIFVDANAANFQPVPLAHVVGAAIGGTRWAA